MIPSVLISEQRTGSNYLLGQLAQHPKLVNFGELFNPKQVSAVPATLSRDEYVARKAADPVLLLEEHVLPESEIDEEPPAVIVKVQYQNVRSLDGDRIMGHLARISDRLRVIHLVRRNAFDRYVSKLNAEKTQKYYVRRDAEGPRLPDPYRIRRSDAQRDMRTYLRQVEAVRLRIAAWPNVKTLYYEDLIGSRRESVREVFAFLSLEAIETEVRTRKQSIPARFQVANYGRLREQFRGSEFAEFFEGSPGCGRESTDSGWPLLKRLIPGKWR